MTKIVRAPPVPMPRGEGMAFRAGLFSDGACTIQKGFGVVELDRNDVLSLFELIAPYAVGVKRGR